MSDVHFDKNSYNRALRQVAEEEGLKDVSFEISAGSSKGDNYMGCIYRVRAHGKRCCQPETLNLILKTCAKEDLGDRNVPTEAAYKRENFVYNTVLRELQRVQDEAVVDPGCKFSFVKCYLTSDDYMEEMLVLEDLKVKGFIMYDRLKSTDYSHTALVMTALAKLHALSYVMKARKPTLFEELASKCPEIMCSGPFERSFEDLLNAGAEMALSVIEDPKNKAKVENVLKVILGRMRAATSPGKHGVLGHGDCWVNNMLFKYMDGLPVDIRLLDFQLMRYASPAVDIVYFIFCCTDRVFRSKHYFSMLDVYHNALSASLKEYSLDVNNFMSKKAFLQEIQKCADFGLGMAMVTLRIIASDVEDAIDFTKVINDPVIKVTFPTGEGYDRYVERVNGVVRDFVDYGYLK